MVNCRFFQRVVDFKLSSSSFLFLASQIQQEHSMEDLVKFLMLFLIRVLLKPGFFR